MARRFTRRRGGTVDATFERGELELLEGLPEQLRALYGGTADDPARARLFPRAYLDPTEEQAESEWEELVHPGLLEARLDALSILETTIAAAEPAKRDRVVVHLSTEQANAWLNVLNDTRLALGVPPRGHRRHRPRHPRPVRPERADARRLRLAHLPRGGARRHAAQRHAGLVSPPRRGGLMGYLDGKTIAVTGAGRGIGRAVALACAAAGANVVVNDFGVSIDGQDPDSEIANAVVAEINAAGGHATAVADSVTTMAGGARIVQTAVDTYGRIDGVVCVAGILRERMLFNMAEDEWDPVIETHLKGTFTVFRAAAPVMRAQKAGTLIGFTSGAFAGSVAQANYSAAKGGIVSLTRSAALGMHKYGVTANVIAPVAKSRMSGNVPFGLEMGEPEDVAPMVVFLLGDAARNVTGQVYTANGPTIAVWNQPAEVRSMRTEGRWTPEEIAARFDEVGQERMPMLDRLEAMAQAAASGDKPNQ